MNVVTSSAWRAEPSVDAALLYDELLKRTLLNWHYGEHHVRDMPEYSLKRRLLARFLGRSGLKACVPDPIPRDQLTDGRGMHTGAYTLVGLKRLDNVQQCLLDVLANDVPGDFLEAGVWRGGTCIFARGLLKAHGVTDRKVWVADSFQGLPPPSPDEFPQDAAEWMHEAKELAISCDKVKANFRRFDLLDDQVGFIEGFFGDTLADAPVEKLAVLRLDGDMYESTIDTLVPLYPKLSPGGFLIVDDYHRENCRQAVDDYRAEHGITDRVKRIDWASAYWQKSA